MTNWLRLILFATVVGFAKAHHFIQVVILAGLGLAGLWMLHTLAQDYSNIQSNQASGLSIGGDTRIFKRSTFDASHGQIRWEAVLSRDPASCARSFLCQLAATEENSLTKEGEVDDGDNQCVHDKDLPPLATAERDSWAGKQLQEALKNGKKVDHPSGCMKIYKYCPYNSRMMMALLRLFGR
ncbi:hypothetical protein NQ318_013330 [Aromia moschata]|uniref:Uncharacterized protein n=1 Tax=Aromia moschata TaxID=1265417 RepID=A0AAV8XXX7_9CUCU|nr:hypothetical protein NQ318_013330 [Aromia moschata]